jgi:uncharacterized membrane protein YfcA
LWRHAKSTNTNARDSFQFNLLAPTRCGAGVTKVSRRFPYNPATVIEFAPHIPPVIGFLLAGLGVIILGVAKSGFGGGVGIIAVPMFAIAFGAQRGGAILLPLLLAADTFSVWHHWGTWDKKTLRVLAPGTLFGIAAGSVALYLIVIGPDFPPTTSTTITTNTTKKSAEDILNLITGVVSVLYVVLDQIRNRLAPGWHLKADHKSGFVAGTAVGVISTLAHAAGPVAAIFLLNQGLVRQVFIGTTVIYFFCVNFIKLIPYILIPGLIARDSLLAGLCLVPLVPVGTFLGAWMMRRMSDRMFKSVILVIVFISGLQLVIDAFLPVKMMTWLFGK